MVNGMICATNKSTSSVVDVFGVTDINGTKKIALRSDGALSLELGAVTAGSLGTLVKYQLVYNLDGTVAGKIPVYDNIS
jgi:hypothetical protein